MQSQYLYQELTQSNELVKILSGLWAVAMQCGGQKRAEEEAVEKLIKIKEMLRIANWIEAESRANEGKRRPK